MFSFWCWLPIHLPWKVVSRGDDSDHFAGTRHFEARGGFPDVAPPVIDMILYELSRFIRDLPAGRRQRRQRDEEHFGDCDSDERTVRFQSITGIGVRQL